MIASVNGTFVDPTEVRLSLTDGALLYGDSLFETLRADDGRVRFLTTHLDRLEASARLLAFPCDRAAIKTALEEAAERLAAPVARLRLTVSRGPFGGLAFPPPAEGWFSVTANPYAPPDEAERTRGATCLVAPNRRVNPLSHLPQMKRGNYADCLYASAWARSRGAREALFVDEGGDVLEGATSNLFLMRDGRLVTPPTGELVLAGVMRRQVLRAARRLGLSTEERAVSREELFDAEEVFLTNVLIELLPVAAVDSRPCRRGDLWRRLLAGVVDDLST